MCYWQHVLGAVTALEVFVNGVACVRINVVNLSQHNCLKAQTALVMQYALYACKTLYTLLHVLADTACFVAAMHNSAYGENVFILVQNLAIVALIWKFAQPAVARPTMVLIATTFFMVSGKCNSVQH
jgi:hypothetical protein